MKSALLASTFLAVLAGASMAAANATVKYLERNRARVYSHLFAMGERLRDGLKELCARHGMPALLGGVVLTSRR